MNEGSTGRGTQAPSLEARHARLRDGCGPPGSRAARRRRPDGHPVLVWSALTRAGLGFGRACLFSVVAVAIRELIDASAHRLIMRAWRSRDPHGLLLTIHRRDLPRGRGIPGRSPPRPGVDDGADGSHVAAVHGLRRSH